MLNGKRVLTVDDSDTIRTYLRNLFTQKGAVIDGAATGEEGLEMCARQQYDLILLDLLLPDMDGIEVLKNIRLTNDISTIVMITGHGGVKSAIAAVQLGADGYIEKQDITSTVRDHVEFLYALEQAINQRAGVVAKHQLEQVRADFYSMVTHDLRNPTTLILMAAEMLGDDSAEPLTPKQQEFVTLISQGANRLIHLINDYLDFAKIDAGYLRLDIGEVELQQVVESSAHFARLQARSRHQTLTLDVPAEPIRAYVDAERLKQVFDNLLSNAIKYTTEGGSITLQLRAEAQQAMFRVSDTGIGISPEQIPAIFAKYHRISGETTRLIQGTGLGLLIVKEIVKAHGGIVQIESEGIPGKGSTFTVKIPLQREMSMDEKGEEAAAEKVLSDSLFFDEKETSDPIQDNEFRRLFFEEAQKHILVLRDSITGLSRDPGDRNVLNKARLASHTLKGNASAMKLTVIQDLAAQIDQVLHQAVKGSSALTHAHVSDLARLLDRISLALEHEQAL